MLEWLLRRVTSLILLAALGVVCFVWLIVSQPFDPGQQKAINVSLDPAIAQEAAALPTYPSSIIVLTYHGVSDTDHAGTTLTRKVFGEHIAALAAAGYQTVRLAQVEKLIAHQPVQLPARALLLTFDTGQLTDWTTVDPVLKQHHFTAVAFLDTGKIVDPGAHSYYLSTRQVQDLKATGRWEFGSHGDDLDGMVAVPGDNAPPMTNRILVHGRSETIDEWRTRIRADLARSQRFFRRVLGSSASALSYPYGETGANGNTPAIAVELPKLVEDAGFGEAFVGENVPTDHIDALTGESPRWQLARIGMRSTTSVGDLIEMIRTAIPAPPPRDLSALPWIGDLADCRQRGHDLVLVSSTYGSCLLSGYNTSQWINYRVHTRISGLTGATRAVIAVRDGSGAGHRGRLEVVFSATAVSVREQVGDDARIELATAQIGKARAVRDVVILVRRNWVWVSILGSKPLLVAFDPRLNEGGVGFDISAQGKRTVTFVAPTLIRVRAHA
jgi:poly-beta-1,6-N-acetyl-D-glucosamine N-deacetylase